MEGTVAFTAQGKCFVSAGRGGCTCACVSKHPWIAEYLKNDKHSAGAAPARPSGDRLAPSYDLDIDDVLAAAWFELDTRLNDAPAASVSSNDFFIRI